MFLKVSKRKNTIRCDMGKEWRLLQIGKTYCFSLVESQRSGKKIGHKTITTLGNYTKNDYEPTRVGQGVTVFGTTCRKVFVKSFELEDQNSFRKVTPDAPIRFYHTFMRKLNGSAAACNISEDKVKDITAQVMQIIPLYSLEDYKVYIREEVKEKVRKEVTGYNENLDKMIGHEMPYGICDCVILKDGQLQSYKNMLKIKISYDFELM